MSDIVDAHIHVWSPDLDRYPLAPGFTTEDLWHPSFTPDDHLAYSKQVGHVRINLVQMTWYGLDHSYIIYLIASDPDTFVGTGIVPGVSDVSLADPGLQIKALADHRIYSFRVRGGGAQPQWGQREDWLNQDGYVNMFATGAAEDLAISFLAGPDDLHEIDRMCERFPETPVIIDHVGGVRIRDGVFQEDQMQTLCRLGRHPRVMVKIGPIHGLGDGNAPYEDLLPMIRRVVDAFGPNRCMWESDSGGPIEMKDPQTDFVASIDLIREADFLNPSDRDWILGGTADAFFFDR